MRTLVDLIEKAQNDYLGKTVFVQNQNRVTYQEFYIRVDNLAHNLFKLGVKPGDRVAVLLQNSVEFVISYFAIARLGAIVVPVNHMLKKEEVYYLLSDSNARLLITSGQFLEIASSLRSRLEKLTDIILVSSKKQKDVLNFEELTFKERGIILPAKPKADDVVVILYTSGTTGKAKGAMLTHRNLIANVNSCIKAVDLTSSDNFVCMLPMFHSFAWTVCVLMPMVKGCSIVILENLRDLKRNLRAVIKNEVTVLAAIPSIFNILSHLEISEKLKSYLKIRVCISGAAALPVEVLKRFNAKFGDILLEGYGLTEASPVVSLNPLRGKRKPGSIGLPIPDVKYKVVDDNNNQLGPGEIGELCVTGANVMKGYYNLPEATKEIIKDGWLFTGDMAKIDSENYAYIVDRKKDMVNVRGLNVYPREVEEVLYLHEGVAENAVVGVLDKHKGEVPMAYVVLKPQAQITEKEIIKFCRNHLANYKVPRNIEFRESLPKNATGKILKRVLQQEASHDALS